MVTIMRRPLNKVSMLCVVECIEDTAIYTSCRSLKSYGLKLMLFLMVVHVINKRIEEDQQSLTSLYQENFRSSEWDRKSCVVVHAPHVIITCGRLVAQYCRLWIECWLQLTREVHDKAANHTVLFKWRTP